MKIFKGAMALSFSALMLPQAMACFTVYNTANQVVYSGMSPPIDMSYQIHERLPAVFPGGHMVFGDSMDCSSVDARKVSPELSNVPVASAVVVARPSSRASRAARNREADALTK
ncbi:MULTISPECIES: hypothetical protein [Polaromonas]|uniref:Uncharacterized protein n=1 Tax=Polaromonas aquatica TaxID=332657 RepID=A0ABW1U3B9_9BURK